MNIIDMRRSTPMSDPLALFTRLIDEVFNSGNYEVLDELVSPDLLEHQFETPDRPARMTGTDGPGKVARILRAGASDFHMDIIDSAVNGDTVWVRIWATGTDDGGQLGFPPTDRTFGINVIDVARYQDGRMVEHWGVPDRLSLLQQLGHIPAPQSGPVPTPAG
jgi:predicted ester cyclase